MILTNVQINVFTWNKESQGLYDYETDKIEKKSLNTTNTTHIIKNENDIKLEQNLYSKALLDDNYRLIGKIVMEDGGVKILKQNEPVLEVDPYNEQNMWLVVRDEMGLCDKKTYKLKEGDILRLGRVAFKVKELRIEHVQVEYEGANEFNTHNHLELNEKLDPFERLKREVFHNSTNQKVPQNIACRFCLSEDVDDAMNNPLVAPCKCSGSVAYIHIECLRQWFRSKCIIKTHGSGLSFYWKNAQCELCHTNFPDEFITSTTKHLSLLDFPRPDISFLVLEIITGNQNSIRGYHVVSLGNGTSLKIGRGYDAELRINDISVSRYHCSIKYQDGIFLLEDNHSKFGTLVLIRNEAFIDPDVVTAIQVNSSVFSFQGSFEKIDLENSENINCLIKINNSTEYDQRKHLKYKGVFYDRLEPIDQDFNCLESEEQAEINVIRNFCPLVKPKQSEMKFFGENQQNQVQQYQAQDIEQKMQQQNRLQIFDIGENVMEFQISGISSLNHRRREINNI